LNDNATGKIHAKIGPAPQDEQEDSGHDQGDRNDKSNISFTYEINTNPRLYKFHVITCLK
jgi:hypothetical protein